MTKCLYFLCPTDFLESTIDRLTISKNYFYSSLGNFPLTDLNQASELIHLIKGQQINRIYFVLSDNNRFFTIKSDVKRYSTNSSVISLLDSISKQRNKLSNIGQPFNDKHILLSYYLNKNVLQFSRLLANFQTLGVVEIGAKIYLCEENRFIDSMSEIVYTEVVSSN